MAVRRIAGQKDAAPPVGLGNGNPQVPETDIFEFKVEFGPDGPPDQACEIEILTVGVGRDRRVEEKRTVFHSTMPKNIQ